MAEHDRSYTKNLMIEMKINPESIQREIDRFQNDVSKSVGSAVVEQLVEYRKTQAAITHVNKQIEEFSKLQTKEAMEIVSKLKETRKELMGYDPEKVQEETEKIISKDSVKDYATQKLMKVLDSALEKLKDIFKNAWKELGTILNYSKLSSSTTRDLKFSYGFSSAQAYGFSTAKNMLGISSDEDLMYMNSQERQQFLDAFNRYTEKYDKLYDSGFFSQLQEYQVEMREFKQDITLEVAQFMMENKDSIKLALKGIITMSEVVVKSLSWLVSKFGSNVASSSDIVNNYGGRSVSVKVDNTFNGVAASTSTQIENYIRENYTQLINAVN